MWGSISRPDEGLLRENWHEAAGRLDWAEQAQAFQPHRSFAPGCLVGLGGLSRARSDQKAAGPRGRQLQSRARISPAGKALFVMRGISVTSTEIITPCTAGLFKPRHVPSSANYLGSSSAAIADPCIQRAHERSHNLLYRGL